MLSTIARSCYVRPILPRVSLFHTSALVRNATAEPTTTNTRKPSSVPKGTVLKGLQYLKDGQDPVALDDSEYPEWLWELLDEKKLKQKTSKPVNRQYHRKQSREAIKAMNFMKDKKN
ncbi:mitochondrial ribosomal protein L37-domain-containing protein [Mucor mucedo]|uniref:mitochondrial ribosomal protein L37-domain-containing protein n=1 Tax=Mucor mucedo TaxID=29922 RepID=UPI00222107FD|nr:mitochondrial ribosomal protein L37-domain-containing protein [Mucor mucedo]KAI7868693.1 mitochondrial ribosomal protein L37-domain-containing protein [Mucor mucedo]